MYEELDVRRGVIYTVGDNQEDDVIKAFNLLREAKLEKESDIRQAALRGFRGWKEAQCSQLMSAIKLLQENKLDRIMCIRDSILRRPEDAVKYAKNIISAINKLKTASLDSDPAIFEAISTHAYYGCYAVEKADMIIAGFSRAKEEQLDSDPWVKRRILEWFCWSEKDVENVKIFVSTIKHLKTIGLDQDEGILEALSNYSSDAGKRVDAILKAYKMIETAGVPIDKEVRKAIANANLKAEKYASKIISAFETLKELKLDEDSALCKTVFLSCKSSTKTAKKVVEAVLLCRQINTPFSADAHSTLLKRPAIALLQARAFITHFGKPTPTMSLAEEPEEMGLIAKYQAALLDLEKCIQSHALRCKKAEEEKQYDVSASEGLSEATKLKETLAAGGNIHALRDKYRHEFRNLDVNQIYLRFKGILNAPENRTSLKRR